MGFRLPCLLAFGAIVALVACKNSSTGAGNPVVQPPSITNFSPAVLEPGTVVTLTGNHFLGATKVQFNGVDASSFIVGSDTLLQAKAPADPTAGTISVATPQGTGATVSNFTVSYGAPAITSMTPVQGLVGSSVVLTGTYLGYPGTTLALNGTAITGFTQSATQITFTVPAGATSGNLVVTTRGGATAPQTFMVTSASALDLRIDRVQLTQSTQTLDNTVPIVAGKDGLIRVFVLANQSNTASPTVKVTLRNNGVAVNGYPKTVLAPGAGVPIALDQSSLNASWNLAIPAADITTPTGSGFSIHAEVDPTAAIPESDKANNTKITPLNVTTVPAIKVTIFPVVLSTGTGDITAANKADWISQMTKMYPVASVDVQVGAAFTPSVTTIESTGTNWSTILSDLTAKHTADNASDRYYFGAINANYDYGSAGLGWVINGSSDSYIYRTALGWDKTGRATSNRPEVFAHELGHNMGCFHSPCGTTTMPEMLDPLYPYAGGQLGAWGYDTALNKLYDPVVIKDIMTYCPPRWVSDYTYKKILTGRGGIGGFMTAEDAPATSGSRVDSLIVRGIVRADGTVDFLPAFRTMAQPTPLPSTGDFVLECQDAKGKVLFSTPLTLMEAGCLPGQEEQHFIVVLPLSTATLDAVKALKVFKGGKQVANPLPVLAASDLVATQPEVQRVDANHLRLTWDASTHPAVMVRDAGSREVIAILSGGDQIFQGSCQSFEIAMSDGLKGPSHNIQIRE